MQKFLHTLLVVVFMLMTIFALSCKQKYVCPAYQSFFILDQQTAKANFSYFTNDTIRTPRELQILEIQKNKHGIILAKQPDHVEVVEMKMIVPELLDSANADTLRSNIDQRIYYAVIGYPKTQAKVKEEDGPEEVKKNKWWQFGRKKRKKQNESQIAQEQEEPEDEELNDLNTKEQITETNDDEDVDLN